MQVEALGELPINQGFRGARVQFHVESAEDVEGKGVTRIHQSLKTYRLSFVVLCW